MQRLLVLTALATAIFLAPGANAQMDDSEAVRLTRSAIQAERQEILAANLEMSEDQRTVFWPLYAEYRQELETAVDTRVDILNRFFAEYETMTDVEATELLTEHLAWKRQVLKIQSTYAKKMSKVLPGLVVARFFQIENKMDIIVEYELAGEIPLVQ